LLGNYRAKRSKIPRGSLRFSKVSPRPAAGSCSRRSSPARLFSDPAHAIDPNETPDEFRWKPALPGAPPQSAETVPVFGATDKPGLYAVLIKWHPGYMSAPHTYVTDRLCFVISGTWGANSGENFERGLTVGDTR
jgi:hypothetical protein